MQKPLDVLAHTSMGLPSHHEAAEREQTWPAVLCSIKVLGSQGMIVFMRAIVMPRVSESILCI